MPVAKTITHLDLDSGIKLPRWRPGPWLLLVPALGAVGAVSVYPVLLGLWLSFRNTTLASPDDAFIGGSNYLQLFSDGQFWNAWSHTVEFTGVSTLLETVIGLGMALLLTERFLGRGIVRAAMLIPWAIPTVVTSKMFGWLFDGQHGLVNYLARWIGADPYQHQLVWIARVRFADDCDSGRMENHTFHGVVTSGRSADHSALFNRSRQHRWG